MERAGRWARLGARLPSGVTRRRRAAPDGPRSLSARWMGVGGGLLLVATLVIVLLTVPEPPAPLAATAPNDGGLYYEIPLGTSETLPAPGITSAVTIPTDIHFHLGPDAAITIVNNDTFPERAGPFMILPGQTFIQRFPNTGAFYFACSVKPSESITVHVDP